MNREQRTTLVNGKFFIKVHDTLISELIPSDNISNELNTSFSAIEMSIIFSFSSFLFVLFKALLFILDFLFLQIIFIPISFDKN